MFSFFPFQIEILLFEFLEHFLKFVADDISFYFSENKS